MRLTIVPSDKMIILDGEPVQCSHVDLSWIPTDVHAVQWDGAKNSGQVEYNTEGKFPQIINEISVWQQAATDHANEKIAQANEREAARNHLAEVKEYRNALLIWSDWTQGNDSPLSDSKKAEYVTYRQALRDLPVKIANEAGLTAKKLADDHSHSAWPTPPT
tara:strand:- start:890 stop:1375 length:486 start_codon:yes stop_codon:yes gene_type:complete